MQYTELATNVANIVENTFTDAQMALFVRQAEQIIYNSVQISNLRKNVSGTTTANNQYGYVYVSVKQRRQLHSRSVPSGRRKRSWSPKALCDLWPTKRSGDRALFLAWAHAGSVVLR